MKSLFSLIRPEDILAHKGLEDLSSIAAITDDSRKLADSVLFFAVRGSKADGHAFVAASAKAGAIPVVEDKAVFESLAKGILVSSTRQALAVSASRWFGEPTSKLKVVGVTGTNGKTTTTFLLSQIWSALGLVPGVIGTVECQIGKKRTPSNLTTPSPFQLQELFSEMVEEKVSHVAIEVSSIALDQHRVGGTQFSVGLFTNLTQDHLDYHGDFENYYEAKLKLFREYHLPCAIVNIDDKWGQRLARESTARNLLTFSLRDTSASFYPKRADFDRRGTRAICVTPVGEVELRSPLIGKHNLANAMGVLAVTYALEQDPKRVAELLSESPGAPGRLERVASSARRPNIFVDYAHSSDALQNVLNSLQELRGITPGRIITVFGCGGDRDKGKRPLMAQVVSGLSDVTVATSDNPRTEDPDFILDQIEAGIDKSQTTYYRDANRRAAIHYALSIATPEDLVLIAGKGHETYQIIGQEQFPFDDREVIRDYYRSTT